jgi:hypothetical protein
MVYGDDSVDRIFIVYFTAGKVRKSFSFFLKTIPTISFSSICLAL